MNLEDAVKAHTMWKMNLSSYVAKPDHSLNPNTVGLPDACELGKWLVTDARKYSKLPEYAALVACHSRFHTAAADVIRKADAGQAVSQEMALGAKSEFASASSDVVRCIMAMKSKI